MENSKAFKTVYSSPLGEITLIIENNEVLALNFSDSIKLNNDLEFGESAFSWNIKELLKRYFSGEKINLGKIPVKLSCSNFDKRIYTILSQTKYGETTTYSKLAQKYHKLYNSKISGQAVGSAMSRNKTLLIIPCHRVIKKDGTLGGFSSGIDRKKKLLELETYGNQKTKEKNIKKKTSH